MKYNLVVSGGTFDRLHAGHKAFLRFAFSQADKVLIGLTSDTYVAQYKKNAAVLSFAQRKKELEDFLQNENFLDRAIIVAIDSKFDQTQIPESEKTALLVTPENYATGLEINKEREKNNLPPLALVVFDLLKIDSGEKISSSRIRSGLVTREGILLPDKSFLAKTLYLPQDLREILHKPFGNLFTADIPKQFLRDSEKIVTVGDAITKRIHEENLQQKIAVIDFAIERKKTHQNLSQLGFMGNEKLIHANNPPGQLSHTIWTKLLKAVAPTKSTKNTIVIIDGEEDLLVIPLILILPLGMYIFYGQPGKGVVILEITEALKAQTFDILKQFVHH